MLAEEETPFFDQWSVIEKILDKIFSSPENKCSAEDFMIIYNLVYEHCSVSVSKVFCIYGKNPYKLLVNYITNKLCSLVVDNEKELFIDQYKKYQNVSCLIEKSFGYLDDYFLRYSVENGCDGYDYLKKTLGNIWVETIFVDSKEKMFSFISSEPINVIESFCILLCNTSTSSHYGSLYKQFFFEPFIENIEKKIQAFLLKTKEVLIVEKYIRMANAFILEEIQNIKKISSILKDKNLQFIVKEVCYENLVKQKMVFLCSCLYDIIKNKKTSFLFDLVSNGGVYPRIFLKEYENTLLKICEKTLGLECLDPFEFVSRLLFTRKDLQRQCSFFHKDSTELVHCFDRSINRYIQKVFYAYSSFSDTLLDYCNSFLKTEWDNTENFSSWCSEIVSITLCISNRKYFCLKYHFLLCKRILETNTPNWKHEKTLISFLSCVFGKKNTDRMLSLCRDMQRGSCYFYNSNRKNGRVTIFSRSTWRSDIFKIKTRIEDNFGCSEFKMFCSSVEKDYNKKNPRKKLTWSPELSSASILFMDKHIKVSVIYLPFILLFNEKKRYRKHEIVSRIKKTEKEIEEILLHLSSIGVLIYEKDFFFLCSEKLLELGCIDYLIVVSKEKEKSEEIKKDLLSILKIEKRKKKEELIFSVVSSQKVDFTDVESEINVLCSFGYLTEGEGFLTYCELE